MKIKIINLLLFFSSLIGYLEWGNSRNSFLFQVELELFSKLFSDPFSIIHPFTIFPLIGQIILLFTLIQKTPSKILTYLSIGCLGTLLIFMLIIGIISLNYKIIISTLPFILISIFAIKLQTNLKNN